MIRFAEEKDIPRLIELLQQVLTVHHNGRPDLFKAVGMKYTREQLREVLADPGRVSFVYEDEAGTVQGHCLCQILDRKESAAVYPYKTLFIDDFVVDEQCRGTGIGRRLYEAVRDYAEKTGCHNLTLHAWSLNPGAVAFYRALGMEVQQYTMESRL